MTDQKSENLHVNSRMLVILMLLVGLVNIVGVIISAVAMTKPVKPNVAISQSNPTISAKYLMDMINGGLTGGNGGSLAGSSVGKRSLDSVLNRVDATGQRVWTFAVGHEYGALDYIDHEGNLQGFNKLMVAKVCDAMGIRCHVIYDKYQNCWTSEPGQHPYGGEGLFGGWYDACVGWARTTERENVFKFSHAYQDVAMTHFYVTHGSHQFDALNITGKKLGFIEGFASSEKCLGHNIKAGSHGYPVNPENIIYATDPHSLVQLVKQNKVDAIVSTSEPMARYINSGLIHAVPNAGFNCAHEGLAVMARKDSNVIDMWNQGYEKIRSNGQYKALCDDAKNQHGAYGDIKCLE